MRRDTGRRRARSRRLDANQPLHAPDSAGRQCAWRAVVSVKLHHVGAWLALEVLAASGAVHAADQDVVNERPPVARRQLEQHWGVDCEALRRELLANGAHAASDASLASVPEDARARSTRQRAALRLCAAIYNAPGDEAAVSCPDYAAAMRALDDDSAGHGSKLQTEMRETLGCEP